MRTINISISEKDYNNYGFRSTDLSFEELEKMILRKTMKEALHSCQQFAEKEGFSEMSLDEINKEIEAVRNKNAEDNS